MSRVNDESGLTLVEVVVAVALLAVVLTPMLRGFVVAGQSVPESARRARALALARSTLDEVTARPLWTDIAGSAPAPHPLDAAFSVSTTVTERLPYLKDVVVTVKWQEAGGVRKVDLFTAVSRRGLGP